MVQITESVHPRSLSFANQRKVVILRDQGFAWNDITGRVVNLQGASPSEDTCQKIYKEFNRRKGRRVYKYHRCGQKPTTFTAAVVRFLLARLLALRNKVICTASVLQAELARKRDPKPKTNDKTTQDKDEEEDGGRTQEEADEEEEDVGR